MALDSPLAVLDLETTGIVPASDRIIEIAILRTRGLSVERSYTSLVRSPSPVGRSQAVHGISDAELADAPSLDDLAPEIVPLLRGATLVAHRGAFDRAFLAAAIGRGELPGVQLEDAWLDTATISELAFGEGGLRSIAARIDGPKPAHRALPDAVAALAALAAACEVLVPRDVLDLLALQRPRATMRDDLAALLLRAQADGQPVGFVYRPAGKRAREDELRVESVEPPYVTGMLRQRGGRRILRGDRILRAWVGARPDLRFLDGTPPPAASPHVGGSRS